MSNAKEVKGAQPLNNGLPAIAAGTAFQTGDGHDLFSTAHLTIAGTSVCYTHLTLPTIHSV